MSEPGGGNKPSMWKRVERAVLVLGGAAALVAIMIFFLEYQFVKKDRYEELLDLEEQHDRGELITKANCPPQEAPPPPPPSDPELNRAARLTSAIDQLVQEAGFLEKYVDKPDFFDRFDRWRSNAKDRLKDGQKLISEAGWTSNEDWVDTFHAQTHIMRDLGQEPYQPEEFRQFLKSGSQVLERMKREVILHSDSGSPPAGSSGPPEEEG